ncbi:OLC1v1019321C1 [Oldenlandia corymbosa var. corymbosa]|uniref:OLC1v1019321C1 n=1 Tax=Oldenlandia corymbosa var. corymbosa TaxID=529605 RepID=A0AAV1EDR8_OLDCO|nr:OLC1v1019321C1 [Oldenlandia corymbosa var. corymbosa]
MVVANGTNAGGGGGGALRSVIIIFPLPSLASFSSPYSAPPQFSNFAMDSSSHEPENHPNYLQKENKIDQYLDGSNSNPFARTRDLPIELINEILVSLPAKSLGRFTCVSKSWLSLISSPEFIKAHLAIASGSDDFGHHCLIFRVYKFPNCDPHHRKYSVDSLFYGASSETASPNEVIDVNHLLNPNALVWPVSSCNGLVCMKTNNSVLLLFNPCTRKFKKLPQTGLEYRTADFGFGYDKLNEDYKVFGIYHLISSRTEIRVYSLKNNSWRNLKIRYRGICRDTCLQYACGNVFWRRSEFTQSNGVRDIIARFDLGNEYYDEMDLPDTESKPDHHKLGALGDCISLFYIYRSDRADIWKMKDSWTKFVSISLVDHPAKDSYFHTQVVCSLKNGEVLFVLGAYFLLYNPKTDTYKSYPQTGTIGNVMFYVESLVSPNVV